MPNPKDIADRFRDLNFHDDTFLGMNILPPRKRSDPGGSVIEIQLSLHEGGPRRVLQFIGCANIRTGLDFDVLAHNLPPNTSRSDAHIDTNVIRELMHSQERDWDVSYPNLKSPLDHKLELVDQLVYFRVQFFGGVIEVIAGDFLIEERA